jgi:hypothetical protein
MKLSIREESEMQAITKALVWARGSFTWTQYCRSLEDTLITNMAVVSICLFTCPLDLSRSHEGREITVSYDLGNGKVLR